MTNRTARQRETLRKAQGNKCCYCGETMLPASAKYKSLPHPRAATLEHLHRKIDGGSGKIGNCAAACHECNTGRGSTDWLTYKSLKMGELVA